MMLVCGSVISQTDTKTKSNENNGGFVIIDTLTARLIGNDLISGDVCKAELKLVRVNLKLTQDKVILKDSVIKGLEKQNQNFEFIIAEKDSQQKLQEEISNTFKKDINRQKKQTFFYKVLSLVGVISTVFFVIK
jgi:hypothetical protein